MSTSGFCGIYAHAKRIINEHRLNLGTAEALMDLFGEAEPAPSPEYVPEKK